MVEGLAACYDINHQSAPWGMVFDDYGYILWIWSDAVAMLSVAVHKPGAPGVGPIG